MSSIFRSFCLALSIACIAITQNDCAHSSADPHKGDEEIDGMQLFSLHCSTCHEFDNPDLLKKPPELESLFESRILPSGEPATDAQIRKTIIEGKGTMPAFDQRLSDQEVSSLISYLHTLKKEANGQRGAR